MSEVYIVLRGECYEGGGVVAVFADAEKAVEQARHVAGAFGAKHWRRLPDEEAGGAVAAWEWGAYWLAVERWEVTP